MINRELFMTMADPRSIELLLKEERMREEAQANKPRSIETIAREITADWGEKINYAARPYLQAMYQLTTVDDMYGADTGKSVVAYFLCNAGTYRGETARRVKLELKAMIK